MFVVCAVLRGGVLGWVCDVCVFSAADGVKLEV